MLTLFKPKIGRNGVDLCGFFPFRFKLVPGSDYIGLSTLPIGSRDAAEKCCLVLIDSSFQVT